DDGRGPARPAGLDVPGEHRTLEAVGDRLRERLRGGLVIIHAGAGAVPREAVRDVDVLLEVIAQREIEEWTLRRRELHAGAEPALDHGEVARGEVRIEVGDEAAVFEACDLGQRGAIDPRPG